MLNKILVAVTVAGAVGLAGPALAQSYGTTTSTTTVEKNGRVVSERVTDGPTVERQVVIAPVARFPDRNPGVSKIGGTVGGAIGGYYINGTTPATNVPLDIPPDIDSYNR